MRAAAVALIGGLCHEFRVLLPILDEHLSDMDGVLLPHLVMSDVVRWMVVNEDDVDACAAMWSWLEDAYVFGDSDERDLIAASGVEMLPDPHEPGATLRGFLGPALRAVDRGIRPHYYASTEEISDS